MSKEKEKPYTKLEYVRAGGDRSRSLSDEELDSVLSGVKSKSTEERIREAYSN